jgi:hypothetical protein
MRLVKSRIDLVDTLKREENYYTGRCSSFKMKTSICGKGV